MEDTNQSIPTPAAPSEKPVKEEKLDPGRPAITEEQFKIWLAELEPFLKMAATLNYAIDKAGLEKHRISIYKKYKERDWFYEQTTRIQSMPGEVANHASIILINKIADKIKQEIPLTREEYDFFKWWNAYHRTGQKFFVTRMEQIQKTDDDAGKILDQTEITEMDDLFKRQIKNGKPANSDNKPADTGATGSDPGINK